YGGPTPAPTPGTSYLTTDHLGSTRVITDSSTTPNVLERDDYLPFGEEIGNVGTGRTGVIGYTSATDIHQKFNSKERDVESNLDYFGARYYDFSAGRWNIPDWGPDPVPVPYAGFADLQTLNLYSFVRNRPLWRPDVDGHDIWKKFKNWVTSGGWTDDDKQAEKPGTKNA
ncbi:MAG TPA: RHS repeat-associated core domain-containing protein, partial [Blastocatellia bacterium]|nr:RHS repeat-associated core domain-containing protein [Blastocatellia bacterium]